MIIGVAFQKKVVSKRIWDKVKTWGVQFWTKSDYFHTEFITEDFWVSADTTGIVKRELRPLGEKYSYFFMDVDITEKQLDLLSEFITSQIGTDYDWTGIWLSQFVGIGANREDKWFCSELVVKLLQICLVKEAIYLQPHMVDPGQLFKILTKKVENGEAVYLGAKEAGEYLKKMHFEKQA